MTPSRGPAARGPADRLPSAGACLRRAVGSARRRPEIAFFALPALALALVFGCAVPPWNLVFVLLLLPAGFGAFAQLSLAALDGEPFALRTLVASFRHFERYLSLFWIGYLVLAMSAWPILLALWLDRHATPASARTGLFAVAGLASLVVAFAILHRYVLVFFHAADEPAETAVQQVLDRASDSVARRRTAIWQRLALFALVWIACGLAGWVAGPGTGTGLVAGLVLGSFLPLFATAHLYRASTHRPGTDLLSVAPGAGPADHEEGADGVDGVDGVDDAEPVESESRSR